MQLMLQVFLEKVGYKVATFRDGWFSIREHWNQPGVRLNGLSVTPYRSD